MVIQIEYLSKLPTEYKKAVKSLNKKLNGASTFEVKNRHLYAFSEKYTVLPEIWKYWDLLIPHANPYITVIPFDIQKLKEKATKDFSIIYENEWPNLRKSSEIIRSINKPFDERMKEAELLISFPHSKLPLAFKIFHEFQGKKVSKAMMDKYRKAYELYAKIEETDIEDSKSLIKLFLKTESEEFTIKNIECLLRKNPWCQNLWKAYIQYLETKDALQVYSRYCRLFVGDKEMKEKYQEKIEKKSENCDFEISEFWIDLIKFEFEFNSLESAKVLLQKAFEAKMKDKLKFFDEIYEFFEKYRKSEVCNMIDAAKRRNLEDNPEIDGFNFKRVLKQTSFDNPINQKLPFTKVLNKYVLENFNSFHLQKLHQTCKHFYFNYRFNITEKIEFGQRIDTNMADRRNALFEIYSILEYQNYNISLSPSYFDWSKLKNLWLTNTLSIYSHVGTGIMKQFFSKIVKYNIKYLYLSHAWLNISEFNLLTESQTIKYFYSCHSHVYDGQNRVSLQDLLIKIPNVRYFTLNYCLVNPLTFEMLLLTNFNYKFKLFELRWRGDFPHEQLLEFLKKNLSPKATLNLYKMNEPNPAIKNFMEEKIASWQPENEKPIYSWSHEF